MLEIIRSDFCAVDSNLHSSSATPLVQKSEELQQELIARAEAKRLRKGAKALRDQQRRQEGNYK